MNGYWLFAILCPIMMILEVVADVAIPRLMGDTINRGVLEGAISVVNRNGWIMMAAAAFGMFMGSVSTWFGAKASQGFGKNLRTAVFAKIQQFSFANLDELSIPSLITRITNDVNRLSMTSQMLMRMAVRAPVMFIMAVIMALSINAQLSLIFAVAAPVLFLLTYAIIRISYPRFEKLQEQLDRINGRVRENLTGLKVVKSFVREEHEQEKFADESGKLMRNIISAIDIVILMMPLMMLIMHGCIIAVMWFGGIGTIEGRIPAGDLFSFIMYISQILMSMMMLAFIVMNITRAKASAARIIEVLETEPTITNPENAVTEIPDGTIVFENVGFKISGADFDILSDINLRVPSGSTLAVFGGTGSGKTSLIQLIPRLFDVSNGRVLLAGRDVREYDLTALRDACSVVLQKNTLFSGTVRSNLQWGNPDASDEEMEEVLRLTEAFDFVMAKPGGLDAEVEQHGANFSGGQKQRLCIARALLKQPRILILDDSTSAIDMATERRIWKALMDYRPEMTKIIISQRIDSASRCDQILVLDHGRISGLGQHEDLLRDNEIYREFYATQKKAFGSESAEPEPAESESAEPLPGQTADATATDGASIA